eukprot:scaffold25862_cov152-Cylindrotheca_fusiformis.AAC.4
MESSKTTAPPLWVTPLLNFKKAELQCGHYETLQRLVTASPNQEEGAEIETVVETFFDLEGSALWRRAVVRSGPSCPKQAVHASYRLPNDRQLLASSSSLICWAAFPEQPDHKLLCVLANPTLLCIWDVYPKGKKSGLGGEGHSIPLPFEACGIYAIEAGRGMLLQRTQTLEDGLTYDGQNWVSTAGYQADFDDDGFVLKAPPRSVRLRESTGTSLGSLNLSSGEPSAVPSLFSLSHPLDDILPVCNFSNGDLHAAPFDDVFEKILFVDAVRWTDPAEAPNKRKERMQPICVTYHTQRRRHAIWELKDSPEPQPQAPLWQASGHWRANDGWDSHLGVLQQDLEDMELLRSPDVDASHFDTATRNEALADALGVRKTPRKAVDDMAAPRGRGVAARSNRKRQTKAVANNNMSLLSPLSRPMNETMMEVDTSVETATRPPLLSLGPFASLQPKIAMSCIYEETDMQTQASNVFLASNKEGSGTFTVCLVCPSKDSSNPNEIKLYSLQISHANVGDNSMLEGLGKVFNVVPGPTIGCIAAVPLKSSPVPGCFLSRRNEALNRTATDLLVLGHFQEGPQTLRLYRNSMYIVDCDIRDSSKGSIVDIENAVENRVDLQVISKKGARNCIRASITLALGSSFVGNKVIEAIDSALFLPSFSKSHPEAIQLATQLRADCVRLEQALKDRSDLGSSLMEDVGSSAVGSVVSAIFALEFLGTDINRGNVLQEVSPNIQQSAWESLLCSEFHQSYLSDCPQLLLLDAKSSPAPSGRLASAGWQWAELGDVHSFSLETVKSLDYSISALLFDAMHYIYEEFKLHGHSRESGMDFVGTILCQVCILPLPNPLPAQKLFADHYRRDLGDKWYLRTVDSVRDLSATAGRSSKVQSISSFDIPPCIFSWIDALVSGRIAIDGYESLHESSINATCRRTRSLYRIFSVLYNENQRLDDSGEDGRRARDRQVVAALIEEGFTNKIMLCNELPAGVAVPLLEVLYRCRSENESLELSNEDADMWSLIGRDDLCKNARDDVAGKPLRTPALASSSNCSTEERHQLEDKDKDGVCPLEVTSAMLFPDDNRIREVGRLLRSCRPTYLNVPRAIEVSDHDFERMKQEKLLLLSRRVLALPLGRGMFTIGNLQPVPAEPLPLPEMSLVGRVPPTNAMLALDSSESGDDLKVWPEFHNGVAAGLRLPLEKDAGEIVSKITRTWIVYNRPEQSSSQPENNSNNNSATPAPRPIHAHGGLLMALGLRGHLTTLEMTDIFDYLTQGTVTTTVGVLLGMAVKYVSISLLVYIGSSLLTLFKSIA